MTRLVWDQITDRRYENGIDRGVLYPSSGLGVVWNGLTSVDESFVGGEHTPLHFDGIKYLDIVAAKDFQATVKAFSAPSEFAPCVGELSPKPGFILTRQARERFNFSYRSMVSGDGYKIHIVYNALATQTSRGYSSISDSVSPTQFEWKVDAVPPVTGTHRPSAHFVVDSTNTDPIALALLETYLYGTTLTDAYLPSAEDLIALFN